MSRSKVSPPATSPEIRASGLPEEAETRVPSPAFDPLDGIGAKRSAQTKPQVIMRKAMYSIMSLTR